MSFIAPRRLLIPPAGLARPSRAALAKGLSFAQAFTNGPGRPYVSAGSVPGGFASSATLGMSRGGMAMVGGGGYWRATPGAATYTMPTTRGTVFFHGWSATASGDATFPRRYMWAIGNGATFPTNPWCGGSDFDNQLESGWANAGTDGRIKVSSASGAAWPARSLVTVALSYGPSGQRLYSNGRLLGSNAFNTFGNTAGAYFAVADAEILIPWARSTGDAVHYLAIYEREFTDGEHADAHHNPWWWIEGQRQPFGRNIPPPPEPSVTVTTTFQPHGVLRRRVRRQMWANVPEELKPVVALAEEWTEADPVRRAVDEALAQHARMTARTTALRRERLIDEAKRAIIAAVERAAEMDDEEALIALL